MSDSFPTTHRVIDGPDGRETIIESRTQVPADAVFAKVSRDDFSTDEETALFAQVSQPHHTYPQIFMDRESVGYLAMLSASPMPPHTGPEITLRGDVLQIREIGQQAGTGHPELNTQIIHADENGTFQCDFGWVDWNVEILPAWELGQLVDAPGWGWGHVREIVTDGGKPYRVRRVADNELGCFHGDQLREPETTIADAFAELPETDEPFGIDELETAFREAGELLDGEAIDAASILYAAVGRFIRDNAGANEYEVTLTVRYRMVSDDLHGDVSDFAEATLPNALLELPEVLSVSGDGPRFASQA